MWESDWVMVVCCGIGDKKEDMDWPVEWEVGLVVGRELWSSDWLCHGWWPVETHSLYD